MTALRSLAPADLAPLFGIPMFFIVGFLFFAARCALRGMPRTERMEKLARTRILPRLILEYGYWLLHLPVRGLVALGVSANQVTLLSLVFAGAGAVAVAQGRFLLGGWLVYISFIADALDGMVARATGTSSDRGEYFDAFVDRYADFVLFFGFMWYYRAEPLPLALAALGLVGSSVMGYARAKGEAVGIDPNVGWMQRHERAVIMGSFAVLSPVVALFVEPGAAHPRYHLMVLGLGLVALFTNLTAVWRARYVMVRMAAPPAPVEEAPPAIAPREEVA
jgi:CDP-diacylglycerol--glycerol-3-phosphate 3-phosphatidyltransferase